MESLITISIEKHTAILTMNTAENRHNPEFLAQFNLLLDSIENDQNIRAVVLTSSSDKNWSLGIDLQWMANPSILPAAISDFMLQVTDLLKRIVTLPVPVIAALNGHTFGNAAVLACACDFRFMKSDKGFFCFPEVDVLVPFLPSMFMIINKAIPQPFFNRLAMTGERVGAQQLLENNVIEALCSNNDELQQTVLEFASQFNKNRWIYAQNKTQMNKAILATMTNEDPEFIDKVSKMLWKNMHKH